MLSLFGAAFASLGVRDGVLVDFVLEFALAAVVGLALFFGGGSGFECGGVPVFAACEGSFLELGWR